ncbi:MAG: hypothetical protein WD768_23155 [Phycisphaeraceae bacterium]
MLNSKTEERETRTAERVESQDGQSSEDRTRIKPPTSSFGIFAVFEACIPGQVPLKKANSAADD